MSPRIRLTALAALVLVLALPAAAMAQEEGGRPGPPDEDIGKERPCGGETGISCWEGCEEHLGLSSCPETRPDRPNEVPGVCTGDEGLVDDMLVCNIPNPDDPEQPTLPPDDEGEAETVFEVTRVVDVACDAPAPGPEWDAANLPAQRIRASPAGTADAPGVTGLDTWLWAAGERAHFWLTVETGQQGADHYGRYGIRDRATSAVRWGPEFRYAQPRWTCWRETLWDARVASWDWRLDGPTTWRATSHTGGMAPPSDSQGAGAAAKVMPQTMGHHTLSVTATWQGSWGATYPQPNPDLAYQIDEIRSHLQP